MITIKDENLIGEGLSQKCYRHPANENLCIKISLGKETQSSFLLSEIKYYKKISKKNFKKFDYPFFSKYHGEEQTNLGMGTVFDLIKDETTGEISKNLEYYLLNNDHQITDDELQLAFDRLIGLMVKHKVIANDIISKNICCKILSDQSIQMIIIDGVGHRNFIPLVDWFSYFAKKKIDRRLLKKQMHDLKAQREYLKNQ